MAATQSSDALWSTQYLKGDGIVANVGSNQEPLLCPADHGPGPLVRKEFKMLAIFVVEFPQQRLTRMTSVTK